MSFRKLCTALFLFSLFLFSIPLAFSVSQDDPWSVHEHEYYGRKILEDLPNSSALLYAYDSLAAGIEESIGTISVYNGVDNLSKQELMLVVDLYERDYTQHFWVGNYSVISNSSTILEIEPQYILKDSVLEAARAQFDIAVNEILAGITEDMSDFDKELYFHDVLAERITYYEGSANCHNAYGAIVEGYAVCDGYAEAFQYLLHREGIQSFIAIGYSYNFDTNQTAEHAWNYVRVDGQYYQVDLTWDDTDTDYISHEYFNLNDTEMNEYHYISPVNYSLPVCDSLASNYHVVKGSRLDSYTVNEFVSLLMENDCTAKVYISGDVNQFYSWLYANANQISEAVGIRGSYRVYFGYLYRECSVTFVANNSTTKVATVEKGGKHSYYTTVADAVSKADGGYVKLLADCDEDLIISNDLYIDLNGHNMTGNIRVLDGITLYGMDSATDDYHCENGYGVITNLTGNYSLHHKTAITGVIKRYLAVDENGVISFHRFFLGVVYVSIQPGRTGMGFKAIFAGDEKVVQQLDEQQAYGYTLGLDGGNEVSVYNDRDHFVSGRKVSMLLHNYNIEKYGETELHAYVMLQLKDGTVIESARVSTSMRSLLENLNDHISILSSAQFTALCNMLQDHPIIRLWKTESFYK